MIKKTTQSQPKTREKQQLQKKTIIFLCIQTIQQTHEQGHKHIRT